MNFAGGAVYTYYKYMDSQYQPSPSNTNGKDNASVNENLRYGKSLANGHCVQQPADSPAGTANVV